MNALADKVHKLSAMHAHSDTHSMATLYSSSKFSCVTATYATATYVKEWLHTMWQWYGVCIAVCMHGTSCVLCQPVHSLSHHHIS